jgi:FkbM family methyltransferase
VTWGEIRRTLQWWCIYAGPRRDITVDTLNGRLTLDSKDWLIGKHLYVRRSHEAYEIRSAVELLRREGYLGPLKCETVLNVGANIGMTCIGLLKAGYFRKAIAFEPAPNTYRLLVRNIRQNGLQGRIQPFPLALSSEEGTLDLELSGDNSGDNRIRRTSTPGFFQEEKRPTIQVPVRTLDNLLAENGNLRDENVDLVWMDIQGHEGHFFQGARKFLARGIPVVSEFWPYGIERSGMSPTQFHQDLSRLFTDFYVLAGELPQKRPISELKRLFAAYREPRAMCVVVFVGGGGKQPAAH